MGDEKLILIIISKYVWKQFDYVLTKNKKSMNTRMRVFEKNLDSSILESVWVANMGKGRDYFDQINQYINDWVATTYNDLISQC